MSYKRLTERVGKGICVKATSTNDNKSIWNAIERLAELEDKIENGTLIKLPCKVGDKVYRICGTPKRRFIKEKICWGICFNNFGIEIHTDGAVDIINDNIFLTKAEAEKKLKSNK